MSLITHLHSEWPDINNTASQIFLKDFLKTEIISRDSRQEILEFIKNWSIRTGEFECNIYVIHKLDRRTFLIYADEQWGDFGEDEMRNRCITRSFSLSREELIQAIVEYQIDE